jgi:polynucleotide 5'-hydroxyl-kinase GRC3/NOL9
VGLRKLLDRTQAGRCNIAVLDSTGYVLGPDALELKYQKMDLLNPHHLVAVQRDREVEPILKTQEKRERFLIHRLPSSLFVKTRSPEERRRYRWKRYKDYFEHLRLYRVDLGRTCMTGSHRVKIWDRPGGWAGLLLGLNGPDNFLLALGILEYLDFNNGVLSCLVPSKVNLETVRGVRLGSLRLDLSEEADGEGGLEENQGTSYEMGGSGQDPLSGEESEHFTKTSS